MSEENISKVIEKCCLDDEKPISVIKEKTQEDEVLLQAKNNLNSRRYSTGSTQIQTRYRGNQSSSTHDVCKHGKRREDDELVIKPWKLVKKKNVEEDEDLEKKKSLGHFTKPVKSLQTTKVDSVAVRKVKIDVNKEKMKKIDVMEKTLFVLEASSEETTKKKSIKSEIQQSSEKISRDNRKKSLDLLPSLKKKNVEEDGDLEKMKSLVNVTKPEKSLQATKIDSVAVRKVKIDVNKSSKEDLKNKEKIDESEDVIEKTLYVLEASSEEKTTKKKKSIRSEIQQSSEKILKGNRKKSLKLLPSLKKKNVEEDGDLEKRTKPEKSLQTTKIDSITVRKVKNKEKKKIDEDVMEKTLYVLEASIEQTTKKKSIKSEIQQSSEKILRGNRKKSLNLLPSSEKVAERRDLRTTRQITSRLKTGLSEISSGKIKQKRISLETLVRQVSFKKGKVLEVKQECPNPTLIKFRKRVVSEPKVRNDVGKKKMLKKSDGKVSNGNGESKREKVVLRHRKVEGKKKLVRLYNNVIEESVNKFEEVRKSKVKALVGAFETVISLQDNDLMLMKKMKFQSKSAVLEVGEG